MQKYRHTVTLVLNSLITGNITLLQGKKGDPGLSPGTAPSGDKVSTITFQNILWNVVSHVCRSVFPNAHPVPAWYHSDDTTRI